jgi:uncharacterized protein
MVSKEILKNIILEDINVPLIINRDVKIYDVNKIYTVIGPRRAGKTYFLLQIINSLKLSKNKFLYVNFEDDRLINLATEDLNLLVDTFYEIYSSNVSEKVYFFFDEIQNVSNWSKFVRRLYDKKKCEIYVTGSSAKLLSKEIATELRGRTWVYSIFPFSFIEYLNFKNIPFEKNSVYSNDRFKIVEEFNNYFEEGGFPEVVGKEKFVRSSILQSYFDLVLFRDVIERYPQYSSHVVKDFMLFLIDNVSRPISINKYYNSLKSKGISISKDTLYSLQEHIEDTFYFHFISINSKSQRVRSVNPKKVYCIDNGLINCISSSLENKGWLYENSVFLHLFRNGYELSYFKGKNECDFIALKNKEIIPIQVSLSPKDEREINGLVEAMDFFKVKTGYIISSDVSEEITFKDKNIYIIPLWQWLLSS